MAGRILRRVCGESAPFPLELYYIPILAGALSFQMQRALTNLVDNAIEASAPGKTVSVRARLGGEHLAVKVEDRGPGMDEETLHNLFVPFYSRKRNGTGLGLATAKKIIDLHRGTISVKSKVGVGTRVSVRLPLKETDHLRENKPGRSETMIGEFHKRCGRLGRSCECHKGENMR